MPSRLAGLLIAAVVCLSQPARSETIGITLDKTEALRFAQSVGTVLVGNPKIVDIAVESLKLVFLTGKQVGETNLLVLDRNGREIARYDVVVTPGLERRVTIHRSTGNPATMSCYPRCVGVESPDKGGESALSAAPAATSPAPPAPPANGTASSSNGAASSSGAAKQ